MSCAAAQNASHVRPRLVGKPEPAGDPLSDLRPEHLMPEVAGDLADVDQMADDRMVFSGQVLLPSLAQNQISESIWNPPLMRRSARPVIG